MAPREALARWYELNALAFELLAEGYQDKFDQVAPLLAGRAQDGSKTVAEHWADLTTGDPGRRQTVLRDFYRSNAEFMRRRAAECRSAS